MITIEGEFSDDEDDRARLLRSPDKCTRPSPPQSNKRIGSGSYFSIASKVVAARARSLRQWLNEDSHVFETKSAVALSAGAGLPHRRRAHGECRERFIRADSHAGAEHMSRAR